MSVKLLTTQVAMNNDVVLIHSPSMSTFQVEFTGLQAKSRARNMAGLYPAMRLIVAQIEYLNHFCGDSRR